MPLTVGIAGFGFMGKMHFNIYSRHRDAQVTHVCSRRGTGLLKEQGPAVGNIDSGSEQETDLSGVQLVETFEELCAADVDIIDICVPTFLHAEYGVKSLEAGKHTFLEKPMGMDPQEADSIIEAWDRSNAVLQVGQCLRFWPEYDLLKRTVDSGEYGEVRAASFMRLSPFPDWSADSWIKDGSKSGGAALDLHIHDTDFVNYLFGRPRSVRSFGTGMITDSIDYISTCYNYGRGMTVTAQGGWMGMPGFPFRMEFTVMFERVSMEFSSRGIDIYTKEGDHLEQELTSGNGWEHEIDYFLTCISEGADSVIVTPSSAREAVEIVCAEIESVQSGREIAV